MRVLPVLILLMISSQASAYVLTTDTNGNIKHWGSSPSLEFFANYANSGGLSSAEVFRMFTNSLSRWKYGGTANISFEYWQGSGSSVAPQVAYDGRNTVYFYSQSSSVSLGPSVIGVTYMYSSGTTILETDIVFNDIYFQFTANPSDTTNSFGSYRVFLENVATHEFGHAYGLAHSNSLQSSMMWQEAAGQSKPSCDDFSGISAMYPTTMYTAPRGNLAGIVRDSNGFNPVFGAYVHAISLRRGVVEATTITDASGNFFIQNLEPGAYAIMVEPYTNVVSALCGGSTSGCYFGSVNSTTVCNGSSFKRSFVTTVGTTTPALFTVNAGSTTNVNSFNVSCAAMTQPNNGVTTQATAPVLAATNNGATVRTAASGVFTANVGQTHYYALNQVSGTISAKVLAYSLYAPVDADVLLVDGHGQVLGSSVTDVFPSPLVAGAPYINYDSAVSATVNAPTNVSIQIIYRNSLNQSSKFPGPAARDITKFYLLLVSVNDTTTLVPSDVAPTLANNARCEQTDSFPAYPNRGSPPPLSSSGGGGGSLKVGAAGCGLIQSSHSQDPHNNQRHGGVSTTVLKMIFSAWGILWVLLLSRFIYKTFRKARRWAKRHV